MKSPSFYVCEDGNVLVMAAVIAALLVATGIGFMRWSSDERWDSEYERATIQAYFLAQTGLTEQGLQFLRTRSPGDLPQGTVFLAGNSVPGVGSYLNTTIRRITALSSGDLFQRSDIYDLSCTGRTGFRNHQLGSRGYGMEERVERTATMRVKLRSFANYMYLTNYETTRYGEIIWFWSYDSLYGRTHSNDYIGLEYSPHFFGPISTSKDRFLYRDPQNIYFKYPPIFNAPVVMFPRTAETLRSNAYHIRNEGDRYMTHLVLGGGEGIEVRQYLLGLPPGETEKSIDHLNIDWGGIYVEGPAEIEGIVKGNLSIGTAGDMYLVDNIRYDGANPKDGQFDEDAMPNMLGLISEKNIIIRDNPVNGNDDGLHKEPGNEARHSIVIDAGMVALNESFTFEHQNDDWESYQGPSPDDRGIIHLKGAVTQWRRGYVHRSNHLSTGYGKDYHYDFRFDRRPPPYYLEATDEQGHGLFDIVSWGELAPGARSPE